MERPGDEAWAAFMVGPGREQQEHRQLGRHRNHEASRRSILRIPSSLKAESVSLHSEKGR